MAKKKRAKKMTTVDKMAYAAARSLFTQSGDGKACDRLVQAIDGSGGTAYGGGWGFSPAVEVIANAIREYQADLKPSPAPRAARSK